MKRGWLAVALLIAMALLSGWHVHTLDTLTTTLSDHLTQAQTLAAEDRWQEARTLTQQAQDRWTDRDFYLHITLNHTVVDDISLSFTQALAFLDSQDAAEYQASASRLRRQLELLGDQEKPRLENLL